MYSRIPFNVVHILKTTFFLSLSSKCVMNAKLKIVLNKSLIVTYSFVFDFKSNSHFFCVLTRFKNEKSIFLASLITSSNNISNTLYA